MRPTVDQRRSAPARRNRFTLIELIVAMGVMLSVASVLALASKIFYDGYLRSQRVTAMLAERMAIDRIMDGPVRNMVPFQWNDENNESRFVFSGEENRLHFTTLRRTYNAAEGGLLFIRIFVENEQLVAEYSPYPRLPWVEEDERQTYRREVLADRVDSVTFRYAETGSGDDPLEWLDSWEEDNHAALPLALQMRVVWLDGGSEVWLRRTAGISANCTFGVRETMDENTTSASGGVGTRTGSSGGGGGGGNR